MANILKKILKPILKEECDRAYSSGYSLGFEKGKMYAGQLYKNEIKFLKAIISGLTKDG